MAKHEEHHLYPAVKARQTDDLLREAVEEHLSVKRIIADLLAMSAADANFDAKVKVLKEQVEHHVQEEGSVNSSRPTRLKRSPPRWQRKPRLCKGITRAIKPAQTAKAAPLG